MLDKCKEDVSLFRDIHVVEYSSSFDSLEDAADALKENPLNPRAH